MERMLAAILLRALISTRHRRGPHCTRRPRWSPVVSHAARRAPGGRHRGRDGGAGAAGQAGRHRTGDGRRAGRKKRSSSTRTTAPSAMMSAGTFAPTAADQARPLGPVSRELPCHRPFSGREPRSDGRTHFRPAPQRRRPDPGLQHRALRTTNRSATKHGWRWITHAGRACVTNPAPPSPRSATQSRRSPDTPRFSAGRAGTPSACEFVCSR